MKSLELQNQLNEDSEMKFFDIFGNIIRYVDTFGGLLHKHPEVIKDIENGKKDFYQKLEKFKKSNFKAKGKINLESIEKFYEFKNLDWSLSSNMEKIKSYLHSLLDY